MTARYSIQDRRQAEAKLRIKLFSSALTILHAGACTLLLVPSFGQLLSLESGADITQSQSAVNISVGEGVRIQCAEGYTLTHGSTNATLDQSQSTTTCGSSGAWTLDVTDLVCVKENGKYMYRGRG